MHNLMIWVYKFGILILEDSKLKLDISDKIVKHIYVYHIFKSYNVYNLAVVIKKVNQKLHCTLTCIV